jgi:hypothetical protein
MKRSAFNKIVFTPFHVPDVKPDLDQFWLAPAQTLVLLSLNSPKGGRDQQQIVPMQQLAKETWVAYEVES